MERGEPAFRWIRQHRRYDWGLFWIHRQRQCYRRPVGPGKHSDPFRQSGLRLDEHPVFGKPDDRTIDPKCFHWTRRASALGTLDLSDAELLRLHDGFNSITIGDAAAGTGAVAIDSALFTDPLTIVGGGSINVNGLNAGANPVTLTARTGSKLIQESLTTGTNVTASRLVVNGQLSPQAGSIGQFIVDGDVVMASDDTYNVQINSALARDQLQVLGAGRNVDLGGASLTVIGSANLNQSWVIIDNVSSLSTVSGTFNGLAEGSVVMLGAIPLRITYHGGTDNNDVVLSYSNNQPPTVAANAAAVSANEGGVAMNSGTFSDPQGNSTVTISSGGIGTVSQNNTNGTWSWSLNAADGPSGPFTVTITATDDQSAAANATFTYAVNNVAPTISLNGNATVNEGSVYTLNLGAVTDPGSDTITSYIINWGDGTNSGLITGNPANTTATHTFADGPSTQINNVTVTDEDGNFLAGTLSVQVLNVAPSATLQSNTGVIYGNDATASFGEIFDSSTIDTAAGLRYAFSLDTDTTGTVTYATAGTVTSADFGVLNAGTHTVYARIFDKDDGFTPYTMSLVVNQAHVSVTTDARNV